MSSILFCRRFGRVGVQGIGIDIIRQEADVESAAFVLHTFCTDFSFMQFYEILYQSQTDTGSRCLMFAAFLIVTVENMWQRFSGNSVSCVAYFNFRICHLIAHGLIQA